MRPSLILLSTSLRNASFSKNGLVSGVSMKVGPERVHADVVRRQLDRHRLGEALHRVLGGAVDGAARRADMAHLRGDVDDRAGLLRVDQPPRHRLRDEIGGAHVQPHDRRRKSSIVTSSSGFGRLVPALLTRMLNGAACSDRGLHGGKIGHVEHQRVGAAARARGSRRRLPRPRLRCARAASHARRHPPARDAAASPMPRPAPETSARLPSRRNEGGGEFDSHRITPPPARRARCVRHSGARAHWPARRGRKSLPACTGASSIRRSSRSPRR